MIKKFIGQYVQIITKTRISEEVATEVGLSLVHAPIGEEGFVVAIDKDFVYLGNDSKAKSICTAISRKNISTVKIVEQQNNVVKLASSKDDKGDVFH